MIKSTASHSYSFRTGVKKCIKEQPFHCFKPCSITSVQSPKSLDLALANDCVSFREFSINEAGNFPKIHRINRRKGPGYSGNESWNNCKQHYLVYKRKIYANPRRWSRRENQRNDVLNLLGRTETLTPEFEIESCPDYPRASPFWNDVPVLMLNHSNVIFHNVVNQSFRVTLDSTYFVNIWICWSAKCSESEACSIIFIHYMN